MSKFLSIEAGNATEPCTIIMHTKTIRRSDHCRLFSVMDIVRENEISMMHNAHFT
jgi:hypothetical protein